MDFITEFIDPRASRALRASMPTVSHIGDVGMPFKWFTLVEQPMLVVPVYLLVTPGQEMLNTIVVKR
jgi:predicted Kef-type K+ transport protein